MLRAFLCAAMVVTLCAGSSTAADKEKGHAFTGTVKKIDAEKGILAVSVKVKKETMDKEFNINDKTKFIIAEGDNKKEMTGKDALKEIKEGAHVSVKADKDGNATEVTVGAGKKK